nr:MFS transporter [Paenibacillus lutrae]
MTIGVRRFLATEALYGIGIGLYSLALNLHLLALGASGGQIASISAVGILIMGIGALPAGMLAGKVGRKSMLVAGSMLVAAGAALFATGRSLPVWYAAQAVASAGFMCIETTEIQLLFRYCHSRREESRAFHGMFAVFTAFTGIGNLIGGILSRADISAAGHAPSLYASAVCIAVLSLLRLRLLPAERVADGGAGEALPDEAGTKEDVRAESAAAPASFVSGVHARGKKQTPGEGPAKPPGLDGRRGAARHLHLPPGIRRLLRVRSLWLLAANACLIGFVFSFIGPFMNVYLKFRAEWPDDLISYVYTVNGLVLFIASLAAPKIMERWGAKAAFTGAFLGNAGLALLLLISQPAPVFAALLVLRSGSFSLLGNLVDSETMSSLREEDRNLYAGMKAVFRCIGSSLSTVTAGFFMNAGDYYTPFFIAAVLLIVNFIYFRSRVLPLITKRDDNLGGKPQAGGA